MDVDHIAVLVEAVSTSIASFNSSGPSFPPLHQFQAPSIPILSNALFVFDSQIITSLTSRLTPYFLITHPTRGELAGPFAKWETMAVCKLALDVAATVFSASPSGGTVGEGVKLREAVGKCVSGMGEGVERYWGEVRAAL